MKNPVNLISENLSKLKKFAFDSIIKTMRSKNKTEFYQLHDMIIKYDAWIIPNDLSQEPIKLSEIRDIDSLTLILHLLWNSQKLNSSTKLSALESIVKKQNQISLAE